MLFLGEGGSAMKSLRLLFERKSVPASTDKRISAKPNGLPSQEFRKTHVVSLIHTANSTCQLRQIHAQVLRCNLFTSSTIATQFISSLCSLGYIDYAVSFFRNFRNKCLFPFNALIRGLAENSCFQSCLSHFILMLSLAVRPDRLTYPFVLRSAAELSVSWFSRALHGQTLKCGVEFDSFVRIYLVEMYAKLEDLGSALQVFDESSDQNKNGSILLWNVLINGFCKVGDMGKAVDFFEGMPERNTGSWNSLINGFMKNGDPNRAVQFFEQMEDKNVITWTTMVNGFSQNGDHEKALSFFFRMLEERVRPNDKTIVSSLSACAKVGALEVGIRIHNYLLANHFLLSKEVGPALVDMYSKCGSIEFADRVFNDIREKSILTWTVMIGAWAIHGHSQMAIQCFKQMMYSGIKPDGVIFIALLTACSHSGQVDLGLNFFESMRLDYYIDPTLKHYALVADMLGRAGRLDAAFRFIERMPITPDIVIWGALFCACMARKNIRMAELVSEKLLELEPTHPGSYVFLSNAYAALGKWDDVERVRSQMHNRGVKKDPGWSFIEVGGQVYKFVAGDHAHMNFKEIYAKLDEIVAAARGQGYMPEIGWVLHNIEEEEKEDALGTHSEKLALAFGLISAPSGTTIRIVKNLRVCGDCHALMKYASYVFNKEIILRDIKRFHHFKQGACSCRDYW